MNKSKKIENSGKRVRIESDLNKKGKNRPKSSKLDDGAIASGKKKAKGSTLSPRLTASSPGLGTPALSPQSSRSGSVDNTRPENQTSRPGTPNPSSLANPSRGNFDSPSGEANLNETNDVEELGISGKDAAGEDQADQEEDEEESGQINDEAFKLKVKNSGRSNEELRGLIEALSNEQLQRYEVYRRSSLNRATVRKLVGTILNQQISQLMAMVVAGFSKVFIGEIVELALDVKKEWEEKELIASTLGQEGSSSNPINQKKDITPLGPHHLREAYRRYCARSQSGPRGASAPATAIMQNGVQTTYRRSARLFRR